MIPSPETLLHGIISGVRKLSRPEFALFQLWMDERAEVLRLQDQVLRLGEEITSQDAVDDVMMGQIRTTITARKGDMKETEIVLCAMLHLSLGGAETFNARQVNSLLEQLEAKPSNISTVIETLASRAFVQFLESGGNGRHKRCSLTERGRAEAEHTLRCLVLTEGTHK